MFHRIVRGLLAELVRLESRSQTAVDAGEHHRRVCFFQILTDVFRLHDFALNRLKPSIDIRIRGHAYHIRVAAGQDVFLFLDYLHESFHSICVLTERTRRGPYRRGVYLQCFLFDVLVGFEMSIGPADLDRSLVQSPVAILAMAFDDAHRNTFRN